MNVEALAKYAGEDVTAMVIQQPNFFGLLEDVDALTDWAHANGIMVIASVNPTSLAILKPPGEWGEKGADIVVGDCQPLGVPLSSGGPYAGFLTTLMVLGVRARSSQTRHARSARHRPAGRRLRPGRSSATAPVG